MKMLFGLLCAAALILATTASKAPAQATPRQPNPTTEARKRVVEAQLIVKELRDEEKRIKDKRRSEFEKEKEEWKNTMPNQKKTKEAYQKARDAALASAKAKPAYKTALKNKAALQAKVDELSKQKNSDPALITRTANNLTRESFAIKRMETEAVEQDAKVIETKELMEEAEKEVKQFDEEVEASLATDPDYSALQQQIEQAELQLTQAKEAVEQVRKSSRPAPAPRRSKTSPDEI